MGNTIVTFSCSSSIHVYYPDCELNPMYPYRIHSTIEDARKHLDHLGKENITITNYYGRNRETT
jgi:hypothetical protein